MNISVKEEAEGQGAGSKGQQFSSFFFSPLPPAWFGQKDLF
jgi:hypothetical protein